jgi:hypothetical protein
MLLVKRIIFFLQTFGTIFSYSMSSNSQWQPGTQHSGVTGVGGYKIEYAYFLGDYEAQHETTKQVITN